MTADGGDASSETVTSSRVRRYGWLAFPLLGVLAAVAAHLVHTALAWSTSAQEWQATQPWVPTIVPAHAGYTVEPWPALIWLTLLLALGSFLAACSVMVLSIIGDRPWWLRALALWGGVVVVAVGVAGIAQLGQWLLWTETFGGLGGSHIQMFTVPALLEATRWGLIWGWLPAAVTTVLSAPGSFRGDRRHAVLTGSVIVVAVVVTSVCLAASTRGAALSARTEVAQPEETAPQGESGAPAATDPPSSVAPTDDPGFPGRCSANDVIVTIAGVDAAAGSRFLALNARNISPKACDLSGRPDLAFAAPDGNAIRPTITPKEHSAMGEPIGDGAVTLNPGDAVRAELVWRAPTGRPIELTVLMAPYAGAERTMETETLDIVDGAEMRLTRWYAGE